MLIRLVTRNVQQNLSYLVLPSLCGFVFICFAVLMRILLCWLGTSRRVWTSSSSVNEDANSAEVEAHSRMCSEILPLFFGPQVWERPDLHLHRRGGGVREPVPCHEHLRAWHHRAVQGPWAIRASAPPLRYRRRRLQGDEEEEQRHVHCDLRYAYGIVCLQGDGHTVLIAGWSFRNPLLVAWSRFYVPLLLWQYFCCLTLHRRGSDRHTCLCAAGLGAVLCDPETLHITIFTVIMCTGFHISKEIFTRVHGNKSCQSKSILMYDSDGILCSNSKM